MYFAQMNKLKDVCNILIDSELLLLLLFNYCFSYCYCYSIIARYNLMRRLARCAFLQCSPLSLTIKQNMFFRSKNRKERKRKKKIEKKEKEWIWKGLQKTFFFFCKKMKKIEFWSECFKYFQFIKNNWRKDKGLSHTGPSWPNLQGQNKDLSESESVDINFYLFAFSKKQ
jgi:hypothetical protein